ncbi:hypothetical protein [Paraburkholderia sp. BCC1886]|uniref:hypothetical protein n=1 Tax=Paraburkholderia sp. BCC1886 TaxID=2562670 RepID=UPI0021B2EED8|nr:hypothetical protein [Paraburkholderia sp. BCC1886]
MNGGGFINTSRAILTTGTPNYAADGAVASFDVRGGSIDVQGAGLDGGATGQIDLLSRVMHANAAIHAKNLNVIAGANRVGHDALDATAIAGEGLTPYISIDVSQIGGMYANSIVLVGTEAGVGVSSKGVLAAQAGDFTVTAEGRLILTGQTEASGDIRLSGRDGVGNSGTVYAQRDVTVASAGALTNSGVVAAERDVTVKAASIASDGTLGAGINGDGSVAQAGELRLDATGALTATGRNVAGGSATIQGASVNLSGSRTSANGDLRLTATAGDLAASNATIVAGRALDVRAAGMLLNDRGMLSSGGPLTINARTGDGGANYSTHGNTSGRNTGGGSPMPGQDDHGSDGAITHSGISAGTISVTDPAIQLQDIASLNRDTSNTNGTITTLPDVNRLLDQQADRMSASGAAGEAVSRRIHGEQCGPLQSKHK